MTRQPFSGNDQVSAFWRMARRSLSPLIDIRNLKGLRFSAAIVTLFFLSTVYAPAQSNSNSPLGTNLAEVSYFTSEQPFLNIFKTGASWSTRATSAINTDTGEEVALYQHFLQFKWLSNHIVSRCWLQIQCCVCAFVKGTKFR